MLTSIEVLNFENLNLSVSLNVYVAPGHTFMKLWNHIDQSLFSQDALFQPTV